MALDARIIGGSSTANEPNVDAGFNLAVALPQDLAYSGYNRPMSEVDAGQVTGTPFLLGGEVSEDFRARVELDSIIDYEKFNYVAQNSSKHIYRNTTMTMTWASGALNTNASAINTTTTGALLATYRHFPIFAGAETYAYFKLAFTGTWAVTNKVIDVGLFTANTSTPYAPTDGVFIRANSSGLFGVICVNGAETTTSAFVLESGGAAFVPTIGTFYDCIVTVGENNVVFWMNMRDADGYYKMMGRLVTPLGAGVPIYAASVPFSIRDANTGATSAVMGAKLASYAVTQGGFATNRLWASAMTGMGLSAIQGASGHTMGTTAQNANSAAPATNVPAQASAAYATLGGKFVFAALGGAETDLILFAFLNPAPTTGITGRNLVIRGVWIDTYNAVVTVATTPTVLEWTLGVGATAVTLATGEAATTRATRRLTLGVQTFTIGALAGASAPRIDVNLDSPIVVEPGTYLHVILRVPYGTATATELFRGQVGFNAYWE